MHVCVQCNPVTGMLQDVKDPLHQIFRIVIHMDVPRNRAVFHWTDVSVPDF